MSSPLDEMPSLPSADEMVEWLAKSANAEDSHALGGDVRAVYLSCSPPEEHTGD